MSESATGVLYLTFHLPDFAEEGWEEEEEEAAQPEVGAGS